MEHLMIEARRIIILIAAPLLFLTTSSLSILAIASANDNADTTPRSIERTLDDAQIESTSRVITTLSASEDARITRRITSILEASTKYQNLTVRVDDGLVFLSGTALEHAYIDWSTQITKNVDGVVGVINNIQAPAIDYFSLEPVKNAFLRLWFKGLEILPMVFFGVATFLVFFLMAKPVSAWLLIPITYLTGSALIREVIRRSISILIILFGLYFFLLISGLTQFAVAIVSGTGIIGLIIGFAFRDIAENFISSLLISVQRPFRLGDVIEVSSHLGVVRKVTARGTTLIDFDGNHIQIPNAQIYKNVIKNFTANPNMRGNFLIGIGYDSSAKNAQTLALELLQHHEAVLKHPAPQVLIESLGSSTINLRIYFWVDSEHHSVIKVASILMRQTLQEFETNGISMPDDAREVIFPEGVPFNPMPQESLSDNPSERHMQTTKDLNKHQSSHIKANALRLPEEDTDDLSSDTKTIQQQAEQARDPEEGKSII